MHPHLALQLRRLRGDVRERRYGRATLDIQDRHTDRENDRVWMTHGLLEGEEHRREACVLRLRLQ
jgi:hypothetical protein